MFIFGAIKKYLIIAGVLAAAGFGLWKYYQYNQSIITAYAAENAKKEVVINETQTALAQLQKDNKLLQEQFSEATKKFKISQQRVDELTNKLQRHDIGVKAAKKPGLVEKIIDNGAKQITRCFEIQSGAPLTEEEINAIRPSKINTACWEIANPNFDYDAQSDPWKAKNPDRR